MPELRRSARHHSNRSDVDTTEPTKKKAKTQPKTKTETHTKTQPGIEVGDAIPNITLLDEDENEVSLADVGKKTKYLVIFAYPKASTPGCTKQVCGFQKNYKYLKAANVSVFGLSADSPKAQKNFVNKQGLEFPLLSDPSKELIGILGAKKSPQGIKRSHWIFVDGVLKVKKILIGPEASFTTAKDDIANFIAKTQSEENKVDGDEQSRKEEINNDAVKEDQNETGESKEPTRKEDSQETKLEVKEVAKVEANEEANEKAKEEAKEEAKEVV